eukprot:s828_g7.t1
MSVVMEALSLADEKPVYMASVTSTRRLCARHRSCKGCELRAPSDAKFLAEIHDVQRQAKAYERGWKQAVLDSKEMESMLKKERQHRQQFSDFVEDLEKRCWMLQKDLRLQSLPEVLAAERQQAAAIAQRAVDFEDRCEKLQKNLDDMHVYLEKLSVESAQGAVAVQRANEMQEQYDQLSPWALNSLFIPCTIVMWYNYVQFMAFMGFSQADLRHLSQSRSHIRVGH